jgi:2-polyprenyl-3-methyl-5-hydroxy-6-metoxy-1,4-benzoquinol methylase
MNEWDDRYDVEHYRYGTEPNDFIEDSVPQYLESGASILCLGAGEGRNAVWLASTGYQVTALDYSEVGLEKLQRLASDRGTTVQTILQSVTDFEPDEAFDGVVMTFLHLPPDDREAAHRTAQSALKPGGYIFLEAFTPEQLNYESGGPPSEEMLYTETILSDDFGGLETVHLESKLREIDEGPGHAGEGSVVQYIGRKSRQ